MASSSGNETGLRVGFIGLGLMGKPMAKNLLAAGNHLMVASRSRGPVDELVAAGASAATGLAELAGFAEAVITMLPTPAVTSEVLLEQGLLESMRPGALLVDMGTETPELAKRIHARAEGLGIEALDAPVSGGDTGAIAGTLSIMAGGSESAFRRAAPLFRAMGTSIRHVGGAGAGQAVKAVNQVMVAGILATVAEGLALLERAEVDVPEALAALAGGRAGSTLLEVKAAQMLEHRYQPGFRVELHLKDLGIVEDFARSVGVSLPFTALATQMLRAVEASGGAMLDHCAIIEAVRGLSRLEVSGE